MAKVPMPRTASQKNQARRGGVWVSGMSSEARRSRSLPNDVPAPGGAPRGKAVVTSAHDVGAIADAGLRDHDPRRRRIALDLAPEVRDVDPEVLLRAPELPAPDGVEDLLVGERATARGYERVQDLPLDRCEVDLPSVTIDAAGHGVDRQSVERDRRRRRRGASRAAQLGSRTSRELEDAERLGDVVVGTGIEK